RNPWHLGQPAGRVSVQQFDDSRLTGTAAQSGESIQDRQEWFAGTILLETLAVRGPNACARSRLSQEGFYQSGFADSWFARHKNNLPVLFQRTLKPLLQLTERLITTKHVASRLKRFFAKMFLFF